MYNKFIITLIIGFFISIYLFLHGFLLNRSEIYEINSCDTESVYCKYSPYKRIILLVVDALKYEFIDPNLSSHIYHGNMKIIDSLIKKKSGNVYLAHFIADPPTTTLQRIKGFTTGSLPTFIDISNNFGSSNLQEDNIIDHWRSNGFDLKFVGDDTWMNLFPNKFNVSSSFPSFNIKDLDTIDTNVKEFFLKELSQKTKGSHYQPEIIIGHMLGIDHCGHKFGKNYPQMKLKLTEINEFIKKIVESVDKDTLFIMFGDHGMTTSGDHGGDSNEEVDAAFFMLSGKKLNSPLSENGVRFISQIDLVPTLAAITGVPIPFSNLGVVRTDMLTSTSRARFYVDQNVKQISKYIRSYENKFEKLLFPEDINKFLQSPVEFNNTEHSVKNLEKIKEHFQLKWTKFSLPMICGGICGFLLFLVSKINYLIRCGSNVNITVVDFLLYLFYLSVTISQIFLAKDTYFFCFIIGALIIFEFYNLIKNRLTIHCSVVSSSFLDLILYCIGILNIILGFSNSFIVSEDKIGRYFLQTILLIKFSQSILLMILETSSLTKSKKSLDRNSLITLKSIKSNYKKWFSIFFFFLFGSFCLSLGLKYKICREEQQKFCSYDLKPVDTIVHFSLFFIPFGLLLHRLWLSRSGNLCSTHINAMAVKFLLPFAGLCLFFFHSMTFVNETSSFSDIARMVLTVFPRIVIVTTMIVMTILFIYPLLMLHVKKSFDFNDSVDIPSLFRYLKMVHTEDKTVTVFGLGNVYSSFILTGLATTCVFVSVFLKLQFVIGILSTIGVLLSYSVLTNFSVKLNNDNIYNSVSIIEMVIFFGILTQFGFFATGHQTTISNIPWYAAFIGVSTNQPSTAISALMIITNIYSAQIVITLFGLLLPLFSIFISFGPVNPFGNRNKSDDNDVISSVQCGDFHLFKTDSEASRFRNWVKIYYLSYLLYNCIMVFSLFISVGYSRRHLMAWKIFVPKMIYSVINLLVVFIMASISYFLIMRTHKMSLKWKQMNV